MKKKLNIILVNADDLGYGDLSCYGSKVNSTPTIDFMATNGIKFTDFYMAAPLCTPSRGGMLTGCYPMRISFCKFINEKEAGVLFPGDAYGLNPNEKTLAQILKNQDYSTMLVGKWHCGDQPEFLPTKFGFDRYYGLPYSNDMGRQAGSKVMYPPLPLIKDNEVIQEQPDQTALTERYVEQCVSFIRENREKPFFLYLAHMYTHLPLYAPECFLKKSRNGAYGAEIECIDWSINVLMREVEKLGLLENTLFIFTSDNGSKAANGASNGHLRGIKAQTWEGGQRVPCVMYWKNNIPAGTVCKDIVTSMEFLPTFASLAGAELPKVKIDGFNISDILIGKEGAKSNRDTFFYYFRDNLEAVRHSKWKLHIRKHSKVILELYDLESDPSEKNNVYDSYPEVVEVLSRLIENCREDLGDNAVGKTGANVRPVGKVNNPVSLTQYNPDHPYIIAMYDNEFDSK